MAITVTMPQLGETVTEGTILSWAKQPGDQIAEDEVLLEISTDKVDTEVPSPAAGVVQEILVAEGDTVEVGTPLAVIAAAGESVAPVADAEPAPAPAEEPAGQPEPETEHEPEPAAAPAPEPAPEPAAAPTPAPVAAAVADGPRRGVLSPVVRRLAAEHEIDLDLVAGTGEGGRITRKDVMTYIESGGGGAAPAPAAAAKVTFEEPAVAATEPAPAPAAPAPPPEPVTPTPAPAAPAPAPSAPAPAPEAPAAAEPAPEPATAPPAAVPPAAAPPVAAPPAAAPPAAAPPAAAPPAAAPPAPSGDGDQVVELTRLRRRIAENMVQAKRTAAHVWASVEVDYEAVERVRRAHKAAWKAKEGFSLTYLPFVARATMDALAAYPVVNSSFLLDEGRQIVHGRVNLGIAVDMNQKGLVVVSVRNADSLQLGGLAREIRTMATKATDGKLEPDDISGSTFTITNPGPFGSFMTNPIINVPNVGILSTDTVTKRPTVITLPDGTDTIAIHHIGYLGLTWDHRAFDGSTAVLFLNRIKSNLETWDWEQELA